MINIPIIPYNNDLTNKKRGYTDDLIEHLKDKEEAE